LGDKAYSALKNLLLAWQNRVLPFVPFKSNAKAVHRTRDPLWTRLYHFYLPAADAAAYIVLSAIVGVMILVPRMMCI
jgi:hypothetical protein